MIFCKYENSKMRYKDGNKQGEGGEVYPIPLLIFYCDSYFLFYSPINLMELGRRIPL